MSRCYVLCIVALLAYGALVGCWDGEHRDATADERITLSRGRYVREWMHLCQCGKRRPYVEIWR